MSEKIESNGNVILIEPNLVNVNENIVNGIPQYQDMYIFAELTAKSKGRTIIIDGNTNSTKSKIINFIGNDQNNEDLNNPNYLNFTTNYYEGSTGDKTHYEGFGINNIKIVINSSFIPQVDIQFVDIRGLAFFNQADSPYRILFDFPPPIFTLTVKGYYGKPLTYQLHLVKYTSEFSAANGNFIIDAQFVAMTFAPLSDILFRYVVNTPLIGNEASMNPEPGFAPTNTYELILKLKNLYAAVRKKLDTDAENIKYKNILIDIEKIDSTFEILKKENYKENEILKPAGTPCLITRTPDPNDGLLIFPQTNSVPQDKLTVINDLSEYNEIIKTQNSSGIDSRIKDRLYMVYLVATNVKQEDNTEPPNTLETLQTAFEHDTENDSNFETPLLKFKDQLLSEKISSIISDDDDIIAPKSFLNAYNIVTGVKSKNPNLLVSLDGYVKYYGMDISGFYQKLYKKKTELEIEKNTLSLDIAIKINAMVEERLGMIPSIYNIFEIILNDVDKFFGKIKATSNKAYDSHKEPANRKIILNDSDYAEKKDEDTEIFAFPLVINTLSNRQERVAPIALSKKVPFPELELVSDFMDTFLIQNRYAKQINARANQNDDGTFKWIPISPFDSTLGGATPESPYLGISDDIQTETLNIILKRFYMLTQGTIPEAFYPDEFGKRNKVKENYTRSSAYLNLYSKSEAINLESTLVSKNNANALKIMADKYSKSIETFYRDISGITTTYNSDSGEVTGSLYDFPQYDPEYFLISPSSGSEGRVYVDKTDPGFEGLKLTNEDIGLQTLSENTNNPVDNFKDEIKISGFWGNKSSAEYYFDFTEQNLLYLRDKTIKKGVNIIDYNGEIRTYSRYLSGRNYYYADLTISGARHGEVKDYYTAYPGWENKNQTDAQRQQIAYTQGNGAFKEVIDSEGKQLDYGADIIGIWSEQLGQYDSYIIDDITGTTQLSSMIVLSNFGYTISPFNKFPNLLNTLVFDTPSAIEVPAFYSAYVGALITAEEQGWMDDVVDFFTINGGSYLDNRGFFVLADAHDANQYLSVKDKEKFKSAYMTYMTMHVDIVREIKDMYGWVHDSRNAAIKPDYDTYNGHERTLYSYFLNQNGNVRKDVKGNKGMFFNVIANLIVRESIVNYSQITFQMSNIIPPYPAGYTPIKTLNQNSLTVGGNKYIKEFNDNYFINLFTSLSTLIYETDKKLKEEEEELKKVKGDANIINQLYYSFKNINDKWLTGTAKGKMNYPFSKGDDSKLIDSFAFVDRGMNPIGETILNAEILGDMLDDPNISLWSVLSQLISSNGFEFFPLQNFLSFKNENSWEDSFKIHTGGYDDTQNPFFVVMYIGGSSSYPSVSGNGFENDGIINILDPGAGFSGDDSGMEYEENQNQEKIEDFPFREVRAFRVRFGEQNQSMFTDIKIDSKEYPETNESIQILSRLAGDQNPDAPVPIGQSLYNLYENRSYKATVTGFGNAMIQPTQYFQLENIPLFNGAYVILTVEHNITANKMTTSFSGTKLTKYPMPRVLTPVAFTSYDGLSGGDAVRTALNTANLAKGMTSLRVQGTKTEGGLDSELGVDVSHHNGNVDWKKAKANNVKFAIIKLTEGKTWYDGDTSNYVGQYNLNKNIADALANDIIVSYYHFARFGRTSSPTIDGQDDANNFITHLNPLPEKPKIPVVLDLEEDCFNSDDKYNWGAISNPNTSINEYTQAFIETMTASNYDVMIYCRTDLVKKWNLYNYSKYPFWVARYMDLRRNNPEVDEPTIPKEWKNGWTAWQFTPAGMIDGVRGNVDLNVMKKGFIEKYT